MLAWIIFVIFYGGMVYLCRERRAPVGVMRAWFTLHLVLSVLSDGALCFLVYTVAYKKLGLLSKVKAEKFSRAMSALTFGYIFKFSCQHIRVKVMEGSLPWSSMLEQHYLCLCHTSFFDTILYLWMVPMRYITTAKTFAKSSLRRLPVFGSVIVACGHFPVYFVSEESSSFSVNKEKQMEVSVNVEEFLKTGGCLSFFPEGALNLTPEVLKEFRLGSFNQILSHKLSVYYCVTYGNSEVWNSKMKGIPGFPADIYFYIGKHEYDPSKVDARQLATDVHAAMQRKVDEILDIRRRTGYTPWYVEAPTKKTQ